MSLEDRQRDQFDKVSASYDAVQGPVVAAIHRISQERYYRRCVGRTVLDLGNGGQSAVEVLGPEIGPAVTRFVGLDHSLGMLTRRADRGGHVVGEGARLPFRDGAFDYVLVNGVLHHLGWQRGEPPCRRLHAFLAEALRVCARELIVYEPFTSGVLERLERVVATLLGAMPTFMLSESTLDACLAGAGLAREEALTRSLTELKGRFYWYIVIMEYPWLKLPAFLSPFRHGFFVLRKSRLGPPAAR